MDPITEKEFDSSLKDLPNGKASGVSTISYEMLKKLKTRARKVLREFFSLCLEKGTCPLSWKTSTIFPIPKSKEWECDLANTRPIILLETARKCLTKILTNRLSTICKEHSILVGPNYAGLPGESTQEPIQLINNICEEAREKSKELWICFQDTAKAFDTVNLEMLQKVMERIRIPNKAIDLIINLFKYRVLRAITSHGLTQDIIAGDGLDQGETISPLLWRIFYDTLLNKIQEDTQLGYKMEVNWHPDLNCSQVKEMHLHTAATAFMDDTTWIASSKANMQKILDEAAIFYRANDSQINSKKSILIAINSPKNDDDNVVFIGPNKEALRKTKKNEFIRYLGIWLGEKDHKKFSIDLVQREIAHITQALKYKKSTDKQILYILNRVLIPRLEYRIQHCYLNENECRKLTAKYMGNFKNSINISKTCPNSIILHKGIYNLKSLWEIQTEALISNFTNRLNDIGPAGKSTKMRLKDAQILNWEPTNIIKTRTTDILTTRGNFQAKALVLAHNMEILYQGKNLHDIFEWKGGILPIKDVIQDNRLYKKSRKCLRRNNTMFLDQLVDKNNCRLLGWQISASLMNKVNNKGRTPVWYNMVKSIVTIEKDSSLNSNYKNLQFIDNQYEWTCPISTDKRKKDWVVMLSKNLKIIWGKVEQNKNTKRITIIHHIGKESLKKQETELSPCGGCSLNDPRAYTNEPNSFCKIGINKKEIRGLKYFDQRKSKSSSIPYQQAALEENIKIELVNRYPNTYITRNSLSRPYIPLHDFGTTLIHKWILSKKDSELLVEAYKANKALDNQDSNTCYEFYTDGSLKSRGSKEVAMGSAWIQTQGPQPNSTFKASPSCWPSSFKAESVAILMALLTVPDRRKVRIYTDSQTCIDTYHKLLTPHPKFTKRKLLKIKNWSIWTKILELTQSKSLTVKLIKVKAHSGDHFNERVDILAKEALTLDPIEISIQETGTILVPPTWKNLIIDIPIRDFIKNMNKKMINLRWTDQNRNVDFFSQEIEQEDKFDWEFLWKKQKEKGWHTSIKDSKEKAFWIKITQNELPTLDNLTRRKPKLYLNHQKCPLCLLANETREHLFSCKSSQGKLSYIWQESERQMLAKNIDNNKDLKIVEGKKHLIEKIKRRTTNLPQEYIKLLSGLIKKEDASELRELTGLSENTCKKFISSFCDEMRSQFHKNIWKIRCQEVTAMEKTLGINKKDKRTKVKEIHEQDLTKNTARKRKKRKKLLPESNRSRLFQKSANSSSKLNDKIERWIQWGSKWMGI